MPNENQIITLFELLINARCDFDGLDVYNNFEIVSIPPTNYIPHDGFITFSRNNYPEVWERLKGRLSNPFVDNRLQGALMTLTNDLGLYSDNPLPFGIFHAKLDYRLLTTKVRKCEDVNMRSYIVFQGGVQLATQKPIMIKLSVSRDVSNRILTLQDYGIIGRFRIDRINGNHSVESLVFRFPNTIASDRFRFVFDSSDRRYVPLAVGQEIIYGLHDLNTNDYENIAEFIGTQHDYIRPDNEYITYLHNYILSGYIDIKNNTNDLLLHNILTLREINRVMRIVHRKTFNSDRSIGYDYLRVLLTRATYRYENDNIAYLMPVLNLDEFTPIVDFVINAPINASANDFLISTENSVNIFFLPGIEGYDYIESLRTLINSMLSVYRTIRRDMSQLRDNGAPTLSLDFPDWMSMDNIRRFLDRDMITPMYPNDVGGGRETDQYGNAVRLVRDALANNELRISGTIPRGDDYPDIPDWDGDEAYGEDVDDEDYDRDSGDYWHINYYHDENMRTNVGNVSNNNYKALDYETPDQRKDYIGLELEFAHDGTKSYNRGMYQYARHSFTKLMRAHADMRDHFDLSNDSSLNDCGAEMVSLPMTYHYIMSKNDMFETIFNTMREDDMLSTGGFHIHFGRRLIDELLYDFAGSGGVYSDYNERLGTIEALFDNLLYDVKSIDNGTNGGRGTFETLSTCILGREANPYCEKNTNFYPMWNDARRSHRNWLSVNDITFEFRTPSIPFSAADFYNKLHFIAHGIEIIRDYMLNDYPNGVDRSVAVAKIRHHIVDCFETKMTLLIDALQKNDKPIPTNSQIPFYNTYRKLVTFNKSFNYFTNETMLRDMTILLNMGDVFRSNTIDYLGSGNDNNGYIGSLFESLGFLVDSGIIKIGVKMKGGN